MIHAKIRKASGFVNAGDARDEKGEMSGGLMVPCHVGPTQSARCLVILSTGLAVIFALNDLGP